jgi:O-antigen/teichoic acid export membrane protein
MLSLAVLQRAATFVMSFGLAKGSAFFAALALPRMTDVSSYGLLELAITIGLVCASVLGFGAPSVATRDYLVDKDPRAPFLVAGYCLWLSSIGIIAAMCCLALNLGPAYVCSAALVGLYALQFSLGTYTRMRGWIHICGWCDNLTVLLVFAVMAAYVLLGGTDFATVTWGLLALALMVVAGASILFSRARFADFRSVVIRVVTLGVPVMYFGASLMLIFATPRMVIAKELTLADVACFSLCGRIAMVMIFVNQIISTGLFRTIYQMDHGSLAKIFAHWTAALSILATLLTVGAYFAAPLMVLGTDIPAASVSAIFPAIMTQATIWVLCSNLEMFIVRDLVSKQAAVACVAIAALGLVVGLLVRTLGLVSLLTIVNLYALAMAGLLLAEMQILSRKGMTFRTAYLTLPLVCLPYLVYLLPVRH